MKKKCLLMIVDALSARVLAPAASSGQLPSFASLMDRGSMATNCCTIFPSITPAATASLATGEYPSEHGVAGAHWYDSQTGEIAYYGADLWVILNEGIADFFQDFLVDLNFTRLRSQTIFQAVEANNLTSACINYLWFRGEHEHQVHVPWPISLVPGIPSKDSILGPEILYLGDFVTTRKHVEQEKLSGPGGIWKRFGFHDECTAEVLLQLANERQLPPFTLAYFPENDYASHADGPEQALPVLQYLDSVLARLFDTYGSVDAFLNEVAIVITGDHAQSDLSSKSVEVGIALDELLQDFTLVPAGRSWQEDEDLLICPNMRAALMFLRNRARRQRSQIIERLLSDARVDQVIWRTTDAESTRFHIATADRGNLSFVASEPPHADGGDVHGNWWQWRGELATVDAKLTDGGVQYGDYPNALERIARAFVDETDCLWATARLGHEFQTTSTKTNSAGSHGSLHALDSTTALIAAGLPRGMRLPAHPRTVDVAPLCLSVIGIST